MGLRKNGIDAVTVAESGRTGLPDDAQLEWARTEGRVLVTADADYLALSAAGVPHAGIVYAQMLRLRIGDLLRVLEQLARDITAAEAAGLVWYA